jgi:putative flippase GtrA
MDILIEVPKNLIRSTYARYFVVGGLAYLVDIGILSGLYYGFHLSRVVSASISFWVGFLFSFAMQKMVAFQDYQKEMKSISKQAFMYGLLVAFNYLFTILVISIFPSRYVLASKTLAVAVSTIWNYFVYKHLIFGSGSVRTAIKHDTDTEV